MQEIVGEVALPVFAFYLLVACNYTKEIFGCGLQSVLDNSMIAKHVVGFLLLFFLIVLINPDYADKHVIRNLVISFTIYVWFLITTRTPFPVMILVLVLLLASYIASIAKKRHETEKHELERKNADRWQKSLSMTAFIISIIGFVFYAIEKKKEYKSKFEWLKFFSGNLQCRKFTPVKARIF